MKRTILSFLLVASTIAGPVAQAQTNDDLSSKLTPAQKLEHISSIRREVRELRTELTKAERRYEGERVVYQVGDIGSTVAGWSAALSIIGFAINNDRKVTVRVGPSKAFYGYFAAFIVAEVAEQYSKGQITITEAEMERLKSALRALEHHLEGFEAGYGEMIE